MEILSLSASTVGSVESNDLTTPLQVIGLRGEYRFADRWALRGSGEIFAVDYGDYEGSLYDVFVGLDFSTTKTIAFGVGINAVELDVGVSKRRFQGVAVRRGAGLSQIRFLGGLKIPNETPSYFYFIRYQYRGVSPLLFRSAGEKGKAHALE
ncbi:MAG: hypothetical protein V7760_03875 [Marinobacter sp.]